MRKIILCVLLFASFIFAQNCHPISDELKSAMENKRKYETMIVQNGVVCDNGMFYNVYYPNMTACFYENWKLNEKTGIMNYNGMHSIAFSKYDEFGMMISDSEPVKTSQTCKDLYKQFKKDML